MTADLSLFGADADARYGAAMEALREAQKAAVSTSRAMGEDAMSARIEALRRVEAALFASDKPLSASDLARAAPPGVDLGEILMALKADYEGRGVELVEVAGKWSLRTSDDLSVLFHERREEPKKLSQAALETLAIVAYCQPTTRAEIEDVRGVAVSKGTLDVLIEAGWVRPKGRRMSPGRPTTYGTTESFLSHFGLASLDALPGKQALKDAGLLDARMAEAFRELVPPVAADAGEESDFAEDADWGEAEFHRDYLNEAP